jgi:hypothetical protein
MARGLLATGISTDDEEEETFPVKGPDGLYDGPLSSVLQEAIPEADASFGPVVKGEVDDRSLLEVLHEAPNHSVHLVRSVADPPAPKLLGGSGGPSVRDPDVKPRYNLDQFREVEHFVEETLASLGIGSRLTRCVSLLSWLRLAESYWDLWNVQAIPVNGVPAIAPKAVWFTSGYDEIHVRATTFYRFASTIQNELADSLHI